MPRRYPFPAHVKQAICDRVGMGETLKAVCASEGMPTTVCVHDWRRRDPAFEAALQDAWTRGEWRRRGFTPDGEKQREILRRVGGGEKLHKIVQGTPGMPSREVLKVWRTQDHLFEGELRQTWARRRAGGKPRRAVRVFDPAVADRILVRSGRGETLRAILRSGREFPCGAVLTRWRRQEPEFDRALKVCMRYGRGARHWAKVDGLVLEIAEGVIEGASLRGLAARWRAKGRLDRPSAHTLYAWIARYPKFASDLEIAFRMREQLMMAGEHALVEAATAENLDDTTRRLRQMQARRARLAVKIPGAKHREDPGILE